MEELDILSYTGGILDGEGSIFIIKEIKNNWKWYQIIVAVINTNPYMILFLKEHFGGNIIILEGSTNRKQAYRWWVSAQKADIFLRKVRPYSLCKREEIDLAIKFRDTYIPHQMPTKEAIIEREKLRLALQQAKNRDYVKEVMED